MSTSARNRWLLLAALALIVGLVLTAASNATCNGIEYTFYATSACQVVIGTQIFNCPGYPFEDDAYMQSPFYTTQSISCSCSGGGGNQGEGDDDGEGEG